MRNTAFLIALVLIIASCKKQENIKNDLDQEMASLSAPPTIPDSVINMVLQQIPSPLEMSSLIKESGARYNKIFLNDPKNFSRYNNSFDRALNLGVLGTDLGYSNLYEENQQCILYVGAIKELSDELRISQFFDFSLIEHLADKRDLDSLLLVSTQSFNNVNSHLTTQEREGLSLLILAGGWVEALYISCQVAHEVSDNTGLLEKIGEQKLVLPNIRELIGYFRKTSDDYESLYQQLADLESIYENVNIEHTFGEPTYEEINGVLFTRDHSNTNVDISSGTFNSIKEKVSLIRNQIVS